MSSSHGMAWLRVPLFMKILNVVLLIIQSFFLIILVQKWYFFFFYLTIVTAMAVIGELGLVRKNKRLLYIYGIYLSIYLCWACGMIMGMILGLMWEWGSAPCPTDSSSTSSTTPSDPSSCLNGSIKLTSYIFGMLMDLLTIVLSIIMMRFLYILIRMMKRERTRSEPTVTYQTRLPGAPPLYSPTSPNTVASSPISPPPPTLFDAGPLPPKEPLPDVENRRPSLPPLYSADDPAPPLSVEDETPIF